MAMVSGQNERIMAVNSHGASRRGGQRAAAGVGWGGVIAALWAAAAWGLVARDRELPRARVRRGLVGWAGSMSGLK